MFKDLQNRPKYTESAMQAAEILRLIIPQISKHQLAVNPINYTVWYEYYRSINLPLKQAIDEYLRRNEPFTNEVLEAFFDTYIAESDAENLKQVQSDVHRLIASLSESAKSTDSNVETYQHTLKAYGDKFESPMVEQELPVILNKLIDETQVMQFSLQTMREHMAESQREINELRSKLEQTKAETLIDALTGLTNRKGFDAALNEVLGQAEETGAATALLMVDIDYFKKVNDTHGHLLGDKVIKFVADTLKSQIKGQDSASRFGGEEFSILLPNTSLEGAQVIAESIRKKVEKAVIYRTNPREPIGKITISIGVAIFRSGENIEAFIERADEALYQSKQSGRNKVTVQGLNGK